MESGNSGSMSSSGEEEYESRHESLPAFLNTSMPFGAIADTNSDQAPTFFTNNPLSSSFLFGASNSSASFLQMSPRTSHLNPGAGNPFLGFDLLPPGGGGGSGRSAFNLEDTDVPGGLASSSGQSNHNVLGRGGSGLSSSGQNPSQLHQNTDIPVRNPKKRSRASRRAPTTVLTTDTTNFRAMVQEFTGIPSPPFSGSSYSRRLDLLGGRGLFYPIRPSPEKIQPPCSSSPSSQLNISNLPSSSAQNVNVLNMPNTVLTFQSLMQSQGGSMAMAMPPPFEGISHGGLNVSLDRHTATDSLISDRQNNQYDEHGSSVNDKYGYSSSPARVSNVNCKLNCSSSSSGLHHHDKGLENVVSRGEGTVDSWICRSD